MRTIDQGSTSYYRYDEANFAGAALVIRDAARWQWFWQLHASGIVPSPPLPEIDFQREIVVALLLGFQRSDGITVQISQATLAEPADALQITVIKDEQLGMADMITNPFHIVSLPNHQFLTIIVEYLQN